MNDITIPSNINIPFINSFFNQNISKYNVSSIETPMNDKIVKTNAEFLKDHPELLRNFIEISKELVKMGFKPNLINNLFIVTHFQTLSIAIDSLSKTETKWNHNYVEGDCNLCFICQESENDHKNLNLIFEKRKNDNTFISKMINYRNNEHVSIFINENKSEDYSITININNCEICFLYIVDGQRFSLKCKHIFCLDCTIYYLEEGIRNGNVINIGCPSKDCTEIFTEERLKLLVSEENFHKYKKFLNREKIKNDPDLLLCPIADCEGYVKISEQEREDKIIENLGNIQSINKQKKYICTNRHNFCSKCKKIWHDISSCEDDIDVLDFSTNTGKILKKCPKCKVWTEKDEGCNHMHCRLCLYDWCWVCQNHCAQLHFTDRNSPCFGKQFNEAGDPEIENYLLLQNQTGIFESVFFFFTFSFLIINNCIRTIMTRRRTNIEDLDNNTNININNVNNNQNTDLYNHNNINQHIPTNRPNKFSIFIILSFVIGFIAVILALSNGILLLYTIINISKLDSIRSTFPKLMCLITFLLIYFVFYITGIFLSCSWLIICIIYSLLKLIQIEAN